MKKYLLLFVFFISSLASFSQSSWTNTNLFSRKEFIENNGQFNKIKLPCNEEIFYQASIDGVEYCFTKSGYTIIKNKKIEANKEDIEGEGEEGTQKNEENEEKELSAKFIKQFHTTAFAGGNVDVQIIAENKVANYYSYADLQNKEKNKTIISNAFKKLVYKNIYPLIDLVFEFPKDSSGVEYSFVVHPGGDAKNIRIAFPKSSDIKIKDANIEVETEFGTVTHYQPHSFCENKNNFLASKFVIDNNEIGFEINTKNINKNQTFVIDPWTVTPIFGLSNQAYDVDYDNLGNVYAYGGLCGSSGGPVKLLKYSSSGTLLWTFTPMWGTFYYYGDFAIDRNSNSIYLIEGFNWTGAQVIKINPSAAVLTFYPGDPNFREMWRIAFSRCTNQAVIAGGGTTNPTYQTCFLDTNLTSLNLVQYITTTACCHDVGLLALDNYGNAFEQTNRTADPIFDNVLVKLPLPSMLPMAYAVNTNYSFQECNSMMYYTLVGGWKSNGYNGLTTSNHNVYSYDGFVLKKWDGPTGALLVYDRISYPAGSDSSHMYWGGISADDCGNLFLGDNTFVRQYDSTLTLINSYPMPGAITDVNLSSDGKLYVCGIGFVSTLIPTGITNCASGGITITTSVTNATCVTPGSATVVISGGSPPFTVTWNTMPVQYGTSIVNVPPGTYTVTVKDGACVPHVLIDTVTISASGGAFFSTPIINPGCTATGNGTITVTPSGGINPYTYNWSTGGSSTSNSITGLAPGTYTLTITDSAGCTNIYNSLIVDTPSVVNFSFAGSIACYNDSSSLQIIPSGGTPPYSIVWTSPAISGTTINGIYAGIYSGILTDGNGCSQPFTDTLTQPLPIIGTTSTGYDCNVSNSGIISVSATGGVSPYTYSWTGFPLNTTNSNSGLATGIYSVTITDTNQCSILVVDTIPLYSPLNVGGIVSSPCNAGVNGNIVAAVSGGTGGTFTYNWAGFSSQTTNSLSGIAAGSYTLTVVSGDCIATQTFYVVENPIIDTLSISTTYCKGEPRTNLVLPPGIITQPPYQWALSSSPISGATSYSYNGFINNLNNYSVTWYYNGCRYSTNTIDSTVIDKLSGLTVVNVFTPNNDFKNDLFYPYSELSTNQNAGYFDKYNLKIYDRWGIMMFETNESLKGWNGNTLKNKISNEGVYYWILSASSPCDGDITTSGFVTLLK